MDAVRCVVRHPSRCVIYMDTNSESKSSMLIVSDGLFLESYLVSRFKQSCDIRLLHVENLNRVGSLSRHYDTVIYCPVTSSPLRNAEYVNHLCKAMEASAPDNVILISTYEVYGLTEYDGDVVDETSPLHPDTSFGRDMLECEKTMQQWASDSNETRLTILRPGEIVGNGMTGRIEKLTNMIGNGTYMNLAGYDGTIPLIYADDLAEAVALLCGQESILNINDGCTHHRKDVTEAIAHRLNDKRVLTVPRRIVSLMKAMSRIIPPIDRLLKSLAHETTYSIAALRKATDDQFKPRDVVEYLKCKN